MNSIAIDPKKSALVLIDLQKGVVGHQAVPHSTASVIQKAASLAARFRALHSTVVLVNVAFHRDAKDRLDLPVDAPQQFNPNALPPDWAELVPELGSQPGDIFITKRQWGAFHGTELDLQLRRRGVTTIVLGGVATNIGVESTARDAYEHGYHQIFVEDAMSSIFPDAHEFVIKNIFPRIGNVRSTDDVLAALAR